MIAGVRKQSESTQKQPPLFEIKQSRRRIQVTCNGTKRRKPNRRAITRRCCLQFLMQKPRHSKRWRPEGSAQGRRHHAVCISGCRQGQGWEDRHPRRTGWTAAGATLGSPADGIGQHRLMPACMSLVESSSCSDASAATASAMAGSVRSAYWRSYFSFRFSPVASDVIGADTRSGRGQNFA